MKQYFIEKRIEMKFLELFGKFDIGEPPWEYNFLLNLDEREYPKYLAKIFNYRTGEKLPLRYDWKKRAWVIDKNKCKTFNQKIQWLKLYDATPLKKKLTDKVLVRDYVAEKIGEEYLKPVLQIIQLNDITPELQMNSVEKNNIYSLFDLIQFDKLPNSFVMKCSHGCKWQYIIKNKTEFLNDKALFENVKRNMTGWLEQDYSFWGGFEMQYAKSRRMESELDSRNGRLVKEKGISSYGLEPKILIELLMLDEINTTNKQIVFYCFNKKIKLIIKIHSKNEVTIWDENKNNVNDIFSATDKIINEPISDIINQTIDLTNKLIKNMDFEFVRVDWMLYKNRAYFEEFTFTPYSGFSHIDKKWNLQFGKLI